MTYFIYLLILNLTKLTLNTCVFICKRGLTSSFAHVNYVLCKQGRHSYKNANPRENLIETNQKDGEVANTEVILPGQLFLLPLRQLARESAEVRGDCGSYVNCNVHVFNIFNSGQLLY